MSDFVWIVPSEKQSSLGNGGISPSYIIPHGQMNGQEGRLRGGRLWFVLRGTEDRCIAVASIKKVERFREGYYANDFLVFCDITASFRITSSFDEARPYALPDFRDQPAGLHAAAAGAVERLKGFVSKAVHVKLAAPAAADATLRRVKLEILPKKGKGLARAALSQVTQALPLDQIWASGAGDKFGPFSNFASRLLFLHGHDAAQTASFLRTNDPVLLLVQVGGNLAASKPENSAQAVEKSIDLDFTEIDPDTIYAREFVLSEGFLPDLDNALSKTEAAEKLHQDMLRDISSYLKRNGVLPYESGSVDLMITLNDQTRIFEIKSSSIVNIVAQAAKGAFQIACYVNAMVADYQPLSAVLILHKIEDKNLEKFIYEALDRLCVAHLTYDSMKEWPERVVGLYPLPHS
jgi:hypothetical protein